MQEKGYIKYEDGEKARQYSTDILRETVILKETKSFLKRTCGGSLGMPVNTFVENDSLTDKEIKELQEILHKAESQHVKIVAKGRKEMERQDREYKQQQYQAYYEQIIHEQRNGAAGEMENTGGTEAIELKWQWSGTTFGRIRQFAKIAWVAGMAVTALIFL